MTKLRHTKPVYLKSKDFEWSFTPFKGLKNVLKELKNKRVIKGNNKVKTDEEIFKDAMAGVKEIREFRGIPFRKKSKINEFVVDRKISKLSNNPRKILEKIVSGEIKIRLSDTGEYIEWVRPNIRKDIARRLHEGNFSVQDYLDLHGMTLKEAEEAFSLFLQEALKKSLFCVKVIHGRGLRSPDGPVLKKAVQKWLHGRFKKWIIAYSSAKDCDGGLGATYIILKSK